MKYVIAVALVLVGAALVLESKLNKPILKSHLVSDVAFFESRMGEWVARQQDAGKLSDDEVGEVLNRSGNLKVTEGQEELVLRDIVIAHVRRSGLSVWYGVSVIVLGLLGFLPGRKPRQLDADFTD